MEKTEKNPKICLEFVQAHNFQDPKILGGKPTKNTPIWFLNVSYPAVRCPGANKITEVHGRVSSKGSDMSPQASPATICENRVMAAVYTWDA